jgi:hypothetical protein
LTVNRGKTHDYLGMNLDFSQESKLKVRMKEYVLQHATYLQLKINIRNTLIKNSRPIPYYASQTALLTKRACPDIQLAVPFFCTCMKRPDADDY